MTQAEAHMTATPRDTSEALAKFTEYFVRNYPGPQTIIGNPHWHAPKIFRAAEHALGAAPVAVPAGGHVTAEADALLSKIAVLPIYRDTYPDGPDLPDQRYEILPADVRTARAYVEARDASAVRPAWLPPAPAAAYSPSVARMREALEQCARWFAEYAESHGAQGKEEKARRNMDRANFARAVVAEAAGGRG